MSQAIFLNPFLSSLPTLTVPSIGNGTLTIDRLTHFSITQDYTVVCTAIAPFTVFKVIGALDGAVGVAVVGQQFNDEDLKVFLTINQGPTLFEIGDTFEFSVAQGTDLNRENLDLYDELPQKNFGTGVAGTLAGDSNIRIGLAAVDALVTIQDLTYLSKLPEDQGNAITIEYIEGHALTKATKVVQDITYEAATGGDAGNDITIQYLQYTDGNEASATIQNIFYSALNQGTAGNNITIGYIDGATAGSEVVTVVGTNITVQIDSGTSTATQILFALSNSVQAGLLITAGLSGIGGTPQFTQVVTPLTGGVDSIGAAGTEQVLVFGNAIQITLESGVSTATQVANAIAGSVPASALVNALITGGAGNSQISPTTVVSLEGGLDALGAPGAEVVTVVDSTKIQVIFFDGGSTAAEIRNAINANSTAFALVTIGFASGSNGTELQNAPVQETPLRGGSPEGTYSFNVDELSNPIDFYEGNASILVADIVNQGTLITEGEAQFRSKVTLDNGNPSDNSGLTIDDAQKTINNLISYLGAFVEQEIPSGVIDGVNTVYQLSQAPNTTKSVFITVDGLIQYESIDWSMDALGEITFVEAIALGATPYVIYLKKFN